MCERPSERISSGWDKAYAEYLPIHERWTREYDEAAALPLGKDSDEAFEKFRVNVVGYQAAREKFMAVPAPSIAALALKMEIADHVSDDHFALCMADVKRLAGGAA
ncbi:hypothetical protein MNQ96_09765 [Sphingopyxis granuli]|uniref:hypothetical protein n=1 Tax=Sphingopyxis granuli TaxID=267128 RepID=UPI001F53A1AF|nr:hypothetical protein [Sphingopyxis granuli]UNK77881.1 hypothetical protein MNQ96_09765 [Sphingopyxis granuli]